MKNKLKVGILGATGMVGQRFITLLENHPWFQVTSIAASPQSAGKTYYEAVKEKWRLNADIPKSIKKLILKSVEEDFKKIAQEVDFVFCALDLDKERIKKIETQYADIDVPVISNNSAHRWTEDIPMIIPEVNPDHLKLIDIQRKKRGWKKGLVATKPNCSIQSYVMILTALKAFKPSQVHVTSLQSISGAGKTFKIWPEMIDNVIPFIDGEEYKSEQEPLKIWSKVKNGKLAIAKKPAISATCIRVPTSDGHMASVSVKFQIKPTKKQILKAFKDFNNSSSQLNLPSAPKKLISYYEESGRPQTKLDRDNEQGMSISIGRLKEDNHFDWRFVALSHNTIRGAAGGAILLAELLREKGYL